MKVTLDGRQNAHKMSSCTGVIAKTKKESVKMDKKELKKILDLHVKWINGETGGIRADLHGADLQGADLRDANLRFAILRDANLRFAILRDANLQGADLRDANLRFANLRDANLQGADLRDANLQGANLRFANLRDANLQGADLRDANLQGADLRGANLDFSCIPLWCGSLHAHFNDRQLIQIAYHLVSAGLYSKNASAETKAELNKLVDFANRFHRVGECGQIKKWEGDKSNDES